MKSIIRKDNPRVQGCNSLAHYEILERIHEGTYGEVYKAKDIDTQKMKAVKRIKKETNFGVNGISVVFLREISLLRSINHPNIVKIEEIVTSESEKEASIYIIMEYIPHELRYLNKHLGIKFSIPQIKCIIYQLLCGLAELHKRYIIHRDMKTSNILYDHNGFIKICDFGLARHYHEEPKDYSGNVVTLWYRSPELLFGTSKYSCEIDIWSLGIIMAELMLNDVPFKGDSEIAMIDKIIKAFGTPDKFEWPEFQEILRKRNLFLQARKSDNILFNKLKEIGLSEDGLDLLKKMLSYNPKIRISADDAKKHSWFTESPSPTKIQEMPKFNEVSRQS